MWELRIRFDASSGGGQEWIHAAEYPSYASALSRVTGYLEELYASEADLYEVRVYLVKLS